MGIPCVQRPLPRGPDNPERAGIGPHRGRIALLPGVGAWGPSLSRRVARDARRARVRPVWRGRPEPPSPALPSEGHREPLCCPSTMPWPHPARSLYGVRHCRELPPVRPDHARRPGAGLHPHRTGPQSSPGRPRSTASCPPLSLSHSRDQPTRQIQIPPDPFRRPAGARPLQNVALQADRGPPHPGRKLPPAKPTRHPYAEPPEVLPHRHSVTSRARTLETARSAPGKRFDFGGCDTL